MPAALVRCALGNAALRSTGALHLPSAVCETSPRITTCSPHRPQLRDTFKHHGRGAALGKLQVAARALAAPCCSFVCLCRPACQPGPPSDPLSRRRLSSPATVGAAWPPAPQPSLPTHLLCQPNPPPLPTCPQATPPPAGPQAAPSARRLARAPTFRENFDSGMEELQRRLEPLRGAASSAVDEMAIFLDPGAIDEALNAQRPAEVGVWCGAGRGGRLWGGGWAGA